jgi:predicted glycosyltransferase
MVSPQRRAVSAGLVEHLDSSKTDHPIAAPLSRTAPKILLYSHDTCGLGNIRRTLVLAEELIARFPRAMVLIVTGSPMIHAFRIPERTDYIKLPSLDQTNGDHHNPNSPGARASEAAAIRRGVLQQAILGFGPDLVIVDKRPSGVGGELLETLRALRARPSPPRLVVGIRDILDSPAATRASLKRTRDLATMARYYDEVWIYGEQSIFDPTVEYAFPPEVTGKTRFCGYLKRPTLPRIPSTDGPRVLVTTGAGADGMDLIQTYLSGLVALPPGVVLHSTVVLGPQMASDDRTAILEKYGSCGNVRFVDFEPEPAARYAEADVVVSMAGYNTVCELLSFGVRAVLVPRASPVEEQLLRARLLAARGLFDCVEPEDRKPAVLMSRVLDALSRPLPTDVAVDLDGLARVRARVEALLQGVAA